MELILIRKAGNRLFRERSNAFYPALKLFNIIQIHTERQANKHSSKFKYKNFPMNGERIFDMKIVLARLDSRGSEFRSQFDVTVRFSEHEGHGKK